MLHIYSLTSNTRLLIPYVTVVQYGKLRDYKVVTIYPLGTMNVWTKFLAHQAKVEIFESGPKWSSSSSYTQHKQQTFVFRI